MTNMISQVSKQLIKVVMVMKMIKPAQTKAPPPRSFEQNELRMKLLFLHRCHTADLPAIFFHPSRWRPLCIEFSS